MYYNFSIIDIDLLDRDEFDRFPTKVPFTTIEWLQYLQELKHINPLILRITHNKEYVGYFTGGITRFFGIKVLGSPFWGWVGQHMGFDLMCKVDKSQIIDDLIEYATIELKVTYLQITDIKFSYEDIERCKYKLIEGERYKTCYIDLTKSEEELFKNFRSGYRTCVRKFEKEGGTIEEDYSDLFIAEHERQLKQVFERKKMQAPDNRQKMALLYNSCRIKRGLESGLGIFSIKAMLPVVTSELKNISSSYYICNEYLAMFASNASYSKYLKASPNQSLTWYAIRAFKKAGIKVLDMGGSGDYKLNFGADWDPKPIIIFSKNKLSYIIILGLKRTYGKMIRLIWHIKQFLRFQTSK